MNAMRVFRSLAVELAAVVCVTVVLAGCNSSDQQDNESQAAVEPAAEDNKQPPADPSPPPVVVSPEPGYGDLVNPLADDTLPATDTPPVVVETEPPTTVVDSTPEQNAEQNNAQNAEPADDPNPLRAGGEPALRDSPTPLPDATELAVVGSEPVADGAHSKSAFDPIKENGPIFPGWTKPKLALVITGRLEGYIEPCGCAGLDKMMGGMSLRHTFLKQLRAADGESVAGKLLGRGWPVVVVDVGGTAKGYGRQAVMKFHIMVDGIKKMGYDVIALGKTDLRLPAEELLSDVAKMPGQPALFVSANVVLFDDPSFVARFKVVEAGGIRVGVTSVLGKQYQQQIQGQSITMSDPEAALKAVLPTLKQHANYLVLLAHATVEETAELKKKFPEFDVVVTADGAAEPPNHQIDGGKVPLIEVGEKGKYAIVLGLYDDKQQPVRYQRVPLDSRFPGSKDMKQLMIQYQDMLEELGFTGLGTRVGEAAVPHPQKQLNGTFVGSKKCGECHEKPYIVWQKSGHAKAFRTLAELDPPRTFDPECVSCHVIGWDEQGYFPYQGGYQSLKGYTNPGGDKSKDLAETRHLINVGCESCHGPGSAHSNAEAGNDKQLQKKLQQAMVITKAESQDPRLQKNHCYNCHDGENSPEFKFETYWPKIEHREEE
ncbi:MAG: hypothetical protein HQ567_07910 [Candidatus Nealsonbacteria bacterium]|nr:hypothetical protein [Candidatus Nealsonbacteria bacterium]